jgi:hypothetical protein
MTATTKGAALTRSAALGMLAMFLLLGGGVAVNYFGTQSAIRHATATAASVTQLCQAGNTSRAQQVTLWDHILTISANSPPPLHETPAQKQQREAIARAFEAYVHRIFAPRDCTKLTTP